MTFLDVLVDGEVVLEAMLVDQTEGEEIIYKGPNLAKRYQSIASHLVERLPSMSYCVMTMPTRKHLIIRLTDAKYLMLGLAPQVKAEDFVVQINKTLKELRALTDRKTATFGDR